ncbi:zinc ABC transporter substrate-binding protein [Oceanicella sp. SM1341]|uniref:zinc ABC transporter substrate-binding protein n=1 Tax=Oceanicella sp. SM1341 TaxID=1548889 RepID=UPI000E4CFACC|nr:zinc ABC transporter substrate-binding protein [Oceanicella sp. SM1341]
MRKLFPGMAVTAALAAGTAAAEVPSVATDIPPVHSLVARVMQGVGTPDLIIRPGASPHDYALRPSEAAALQRADLVFWVGEELTPWLEGPVSELASGAESIQLLETPGTTELAFREGATFEAHSHGDAHEGHEEHAHDDHEGHGHEGHGHDDHGHEEHGHEEHGHDAHAHDDHGHDDHAHGEDAHGHDHHGHDPHAWLDPENARVWLGVIADRLAALDPEHAAAYAANADAGRAELTALEERINASLDGLHDTPFIVFHDAYQYFETRFGLAAAGAISIGDGAAPGAARLAEIRDKVQRLDVRCVFAEPQFNPGLVETVLQDTEAKAGVLDPLGAKLEPGPGLYPALLQEMADGLRACLAR